MASPFPDTSSSIADTDTTANKQQQPTPISENDAVALGVAPGAPPNRRQRQRASFWFHRFLALSQWLDPLRLPNSFVNYQCVWWKALSGNDKASPLFDRGWAYDMLPPVTRWAVASTFVPLYPRYHHANVELRTAYLDQAMKTIVQRQIAPHPEIRKIRLVLLGCGYDLRSLKMAHNYGTQQCHYEMELIELDLPDVISAKRTLLQKRFCKRRPELKKWVDSIQTFGVDLNHVDQVRDILNKILETSSGGSGDNNNCFTVFVFEAVLVYLNDGVASQLLRILSDLLKKHATASRESNLGCVCFADVLSNVDEDQNEESARKELAQNGWELQDWLPKPGKTRHMGWATCTL